MYRNANRARLIGDSTSDGLADPPGRVRAKLVTLGVIEFLDCPDQADIALLDQVQQAHPTTNILFRYTDNQAQVCFGQAALGFLTIVDVATVRHRLETLGLTALHALCQFDFFLCREQRDTANLAQVHAHGIVQATLQVSNYNAKAIVQLVPLGRGYDLGIDLILRSRLPISRWLFCRIQGIHRLFVLQLRKQVIWLTRIDGRHKASVHGAMSVMSYSIDIKDIFHITQHGLFKTLKEPIA